MKAGCPQTATRFAATTGSSNSGAPNKGGKPHGTVGLDAHSKSGEYVIQDENGARVGEGYGQALERNNWSWDQFDSNTREGSVSR